MHSHRGLSLQLHTPGLPAVLVLHQPNASCCCCWPRLDCCCCWQGAAAWTGKHGWLPSPAATREDQAPAGRHKHAQAHRAHRGESRLTTHAPRVIFTKSKYMAASMLAGAKTAWEAACRSGWATLSITFTHVVVLKSQCVLGVRGAGQQPAAKAHALQHTSPLPLDTDTHTHTQKTCTHTCLSSGTLSSTCC